MGSPELPTETGTDAGICRTLASPTRGLGTGAAEYWFMAGLTLGQAPAMTGPSLPPRKEQVQVQALAEPQLVWELEQREALASPSPRKLAWVQGRSGPQLPR